MNKVHRYGKLPRLSREKLIRKLNIKLIPILTWVIGLFFTAGQVSAVYTLANPADLLASAKPVMPISATNSTPASPTDSTNVASDSTSSSDPVTVPAVDKPTPTITIEILGEEYIPPVPKINLPAGTGRFPFGQCTYYVATRRDVTWGGNAGEWYANAQAAGRPVGQTPQPGSIMVTRESSLGHVAYVDSVNSGGSYVVYEMNNSALGGWGIVDHRTITPGSVPLIGFIY